jgi:hypothetical protein
VSDDHKVSRERLELHAVLVATDIFTGTGKVRPMAVVHARKCPNTGKPGIVQVIPAGFRNAYDKAVFAESIRQIARETEAWAVVLMIEAWFVERQHGEALTTRPRDAVDRREAVYVLVDHEDSAESTSFMIEIEREVVGDERSPGRLREPARGTCEVFSRFSNLVPRVMH